MKVASLLLAVPLCAAPATAQLCQHELRSTSPSATTHFGEKLDTDGVYLVVGDNMDGLVATWAGLGHIFTLNSVTGRYDLVATVHANDAPPVAAFGTFGSSVAISGDVAVFGAPMASAAGQPSSGAAYVFRRTAGIWSQEAKLVLSTPTASARFGGHVDVDGDRIVVSTNTLNIVYVFEWSGSAWVETAAVSAANSSRLGARRIRLAGDVLAASSVASPAEVVLFHFDLQSSVWVEEQTLPAHTNRFDLDGDRLAASTSSRFVRVYDRDPVLGAWQSLSLGGTSPMLPASTTAISLLGTFVAVHSRPVGTVYELPSWTRSGEIRRTGDDTSVNFGDNISLTATGIIATGRVGAEGRVRIHDFRCKRALGTPRCFQSVSNSTSLGGELYISGSVVAADNDLTLTATQLPFGSFGFFIASLSPGLTMAPGSAQGDLCLSGSIGRFLGPGQVQNSGPVGRFALALDLTNIPTPTGPVTIAAGETWYFQAWHRDANPGPVSNFTDSVSVTFE